VEAKGTRVVSRAGKKKPAVSKDNPL